MTQKKYYGNFERLWHWTQMLLIVTLCATGFEIHNSFKLLGYEFAVRLHNVSGWTYLILTVFALFWLFTSNEYKQFLPTSKNFKEQVNYYLSGIFQKADHPVHKSPDNKMNPIQRLVYFGLTFLIIPAQIFTGVVYMYFHVAKDILGMETVQFIAQLHTLMAFLLVAFLAVHMYLITTGKTVTSNLKAMVTGYENEE